MNARYLRIGRTFLLGISLLLILAAPSPIKDAGVSGRLAEDDWTQINLSGFRDPDNYVVRSLDVFRNELYAGVGNGSGSGAQLWRMDKTGAWSSLTTDGFGNPNNTDIADLIKFRRHFYASTRNSVEGGGIYRSSDGLNWSQVSLPGFDPTNDEIIHFAYFKRHIYASTSSATDAHGAEIWRSKTGDSGDWTQVVFDGFDGDVDNTMIVSFEVFKGSLYAGTDNWNGTEVWSSNDGVSWSQVNLDGFGDGFNWSVTLKAYQGYLYAATYNWFNSDNPGFELWRCRRCDGNDWVEVPIAKGFGDTENRSIRALETASGSLYGVTYNRATGIQVWRSVDGLSWSQIVGDGFGDVNNLLVLWDTSVTSVGGRLVVGTWNQSVGGETWRQGSR